MITLGILGTARIARALFRHPLENVQITAVASRERPRAGAFAAEYNIPNVCAGYGDLLADESIDAVYIPLPHHLHAEYVVKAAQAGKHVLVEKPAALSTREVREMSDACRSNNVVFMEAFMYRFLRVHNRAREIIREGTIGDLRYVDYNLGFNAQARGVTGFRLVREQGGGALYDLGVYGLDFIRWVTDGNPELVRAYMRRLGGDGIDVMTHALYTVGEVVATLTCGFDCDANYYVLAGRLGSILSPVALSGRDDSQTLTIHLHKDNQTYQEQFPPGMPYKEEVEYFASCVERHEQPLLGAENSRRNLQLLEVLFERALPL